MTSTIAAIAALIAAYFSFAGWMSNQRQALPHIRATMIKRKGDIGFVELTFYPGNAHNRSIFLRSSSGRLAAAYANHFNSWDTETVYETTSPFVEEMELEIDLLSDACSPKPVSKLVAFELRSKYSSFCIVAKRSKTCFTPNTKTPVVIKDATD